MKITFDSVVPTWRVSRSALLVFSQILLVTSLAGTASAASIAERRADVRQGAQQTLARLYEVQPGAKAAVAKAAGYAVFTDFGMKLLIAGGLSLIHI